MLFLRNKVYKPNWSQMNGKVYFQEASHSRRPYCPDPTATGDGRESGRWGDRCLFNLSKSTKEKSMRKILTASLAMLLFVATGCNKEVISFNGESGSLSLSLSAEGSFVEVSPMSSEVDADVNEFPISVIDVASGRTVSSWDRYADVPETITLAPAEYRVEAKSPGALPVAWNQPVFEGSQTVTVSAGSTETVSVVCTITNMKVSVRCTEAFLNEVEPDFTVTVSTVDGPLIFTKERIDVSDAGYFAVAPLSMDLYAQKKSGEVITYHMEVEEVAARDHHVFTLDAGGTGYADFSTGISIDYTCNDKDVHIIVEDPDGGSSEPVDPSSISITATAGIDEPVTYSKSALPSQFSLSVSASAGVEKFEVSILSAGLRTLLDMMQMGYVVDLANMNAAEEGFWGSLFQVTSADVKGKTEVTFEIAAFLGAMPAETNELEITVTDTEGSSLSKTLTIIMTE